MSSIDPPAKLKIISLEGRLITVQGTFNPKEVSVDKSVPWQKQKKKGPSDLEYTGGEPKSMSFELMFDSFEAGTSIQPIIDDLHALTDTSIQEGNNEQKKRPPKVMVIWGAGAGRGANSADGGIPKFEAVIESVSVKYTMFLANGTAVRATANIKVKEASSLKVGKKS